MTWFSHVYVIAFDVKSRKQDASDVTAPMLRAALLKHAINIPAETLINACDGPYETSENSVATTLVVDENDT